MKELKTIKVLPETVRKLNLIAATEELKQYEAVEKIADDKIKEYDKPKK